MSCRQQLIRASWEKQNAGRECHLGHHFTGKLEWATQSRRLQHKLRAVCSRCSLPVLALASTRLRTPSSHTPDAYKVRRLLKRQRLTPSCGCMHPDAPTPDHPGDDVRFPGRLVGHRERVKSACIAQTGSPHPGCEGCTINCGRCRALRPSRSGCVQADAAPSWCVSRTPSW
jgi:hypothetical protein